MSASVLFTSESVTEGHPDKLCDVISDAAVDRFLEQDPASRIVAECAVAKGVVFLVARFASGASVDFPEVARGVIKEVGYDEADFNASDCAILTSLMELPAIQRIQIDETQLSDAEIDRLKVKNQATLFGFACDQTLAHMPLPLWLSRALARRLTEVSRDSLLPNLSPDATTQVGVEFQQGRPFRIHSITLITGQRESSQLDANRLRDAVIQSVIEPVFAAEEIKPDKNTKLFINPDGPYIKSGPAAHSGMTGRKTASDTYGGYSRYSSSALSGKDPSRIDRIGAYAARYAAKNLVAAKLAKACEVQLSYSIGQCAPVSVQVQTFGAGKLTDEEIAERVNALFDFRLGAIVAQFRLRHLPALTKGFYRKLAAQGHMGRADMDLPWEQTDKAKELA